MVGSKAKIEVVGTTTTATRRRSSRWRHIGCSHRGAGSGAKRRCFARRWLSSVEHICLCRRMPSTQMAPVRSGYSPDGSNTDPAIVVRKDILAAAVGRSIVVFHHVGSRHGGPKNGRASGRERGCQDVEIRGV